MKIPRLLALGALLGALPLAPLTATTVNVKFGQDTYIGYGAAPAEPGLTAPPHWNFFGLKSGSELKGLKDVRGASSPITIWAVFGAGFFGSSEVGRADRDLLRSGVYGGIGLQVLNLDPDKAYDFYVYVYNKSNEETKVRIDGTAAEARFPSPVNIEDELRPDQNYVVFSDVKPNGKGYVSIDVIAVANPASQWAGLNGIQIVEHTTSPTPTPNPTVTPTPVVRPTVTFRPDKTTIPSRERKFTVRGAATSPVGVQKVWYSLDRKAWRRAAGTKSWHFTVTVKNRTRVFVRAEDANGRFSSVEAATIVPRIRF